MAYQAKTLTEDLGLNTNKLNKDLEALESRLESLFNTRWKNDPARAQKEAQKYQQTILKSAKDQAALEKKEKNIALALDKDADKKRRKEDRDARREDARLQLATADNFKDRIKASGAEFKENLGEAADNFKKNFDALLKQKIEAWIEEYASIFGKY